ncbi:MmcQ/YjbR family DNA-binding protein [Phenylobacterium terrae]|uniref:MmcQ/YjbR family DNA-binding protein n=1 Tax=Phenylobacterium terrae TaxID=2665495 RepID=A0ABW4N740_9CAUL
MAPEDLAEALRRFGLTYPEAHLKSPWPGHLDLAVRDKTFAYLPPAGQPFSLSVKLPFTGPEALELPFAKPAGYGLGRSGWVSFDPAPDEVPPLETLKSWIDESYRAQAPKKLIKLIGGGGTA